MHVASDLYYFNIVNLHNDKTRIFWRMLLPQTSARSEACTGFRAALGPADE